MLVSFSGNESNTLEPLKFLFNTFQILLGKYPLYEGQKIIAA